MSWKFVVLTVEAVIAMLNLALTAGAALRPVVPLSGVVAITAGAAATGAAMSAWIWEALRARS